MGALYIQWRVGVGTKSLIPLREKGEGLEPVYFSNKLSVRVRRYSGRQRPRYVVYQSEYRL